MYKKIQKNCETTSLPQHLNYLFSRSIECILLSTKEDLSQVPLGESESYLIRFLSKICPFNRWKSKKLFLLKNTFENNRTLPGHFASHRDHNHVGFSLSPVKTRHAPLIHPSIYFSIFRPSFYKKKNCNSILKDNLNDATQNKFFGSKSDRVEVHNTRFKLITL